ncbi:proteophosphoglycan 5 [Rhodotorula toruloides]|uniref:Proteophosphoglycan 5 n=1 Tax=Rhodotorula toruloides TaxID=5286 RepID=A0A511K8U1_RHOTO|nr:proteophosphoglycan 5 [Rhodotorula toruloides]
MPADGQNDLVRDLTTKLEKLQREKAELERAVEGQADSIALKLRLALLAYEQQKPPSLSQPHTHRHRSKSRSSASSSLSTSASTSSSTSFPSSPPMQISPVLPAPDVSPDVLTALRENETLRVRLANSERVNAYYQRELAELRRRCGISIDELEELDLSGENSLQAPRAGGSGMLRRPRSSSRSSSRMDPADATASIRIPGAASVSPPATAGGARLSTASFPFSASTNSLRFAAPQSYTSYPSSINTTATTPSSSYPNARPPAPTPATAAAFSPVSFVNTVGSAGSGAGGAALGRRNSLNSFVVTHFAAGSTGSMQAVAEAESREIDLDDLVHLTPQPAISPPPSNTTGTVPFPSITSCSLAAPPLDGLVLT